MGVPDGGVLAKHLTRHLTRHLTIGRADKQGEAELFGEVLSIFSLNIFWMKNVHPLEMVCKHVADGL